MLSRRTFNRNLLTGLVGIAVSPRLLRGQERAATEPPSLCRATLIDSERLNQTLAELSRFGRTPQGGTTRLGFSNEDLAARHWFMEQMRLAQLEVSVDAAANLHGRRAGSNPAAPALLFGSHLDTVPNGGNFDGSVGCCAALEVIRTLNAQAVTTKRPFEMIIFSNEEGVHYGRGLFGSRALAGLLAPGELEEVDAQGVPLAEWLRRYGGDPDRIPTMTPPRGTYKAYLELHIEQGGVLWQRGLPIGIVAGIVGINRYRCVVEGFANHAGTTPMDQRRDALAAAAELILAVREIVRSTPGRQVGTVGYVSAFPGATNVIAGRAEFPIELRDLSGEKLAELAAQIRLRAQEIAQKENVRIEITEIETHASALTDPNIRIHMQQACLEMRIPSLVIASGAGHDAQAMARLCPIGMIFIPSRDGISHSPEEYSRPEDVACGTELLYRTLLRLDRA